MLNTGVGEETRQTDWATIYRALCTWKSMYHGTPWRVLNKGMTILFTLSNVLHAVVDRMS
jgi:hypothetical protein